MSSVAHFFVKNRGEIMKRAVELSDAESDFYRRMGEYRAQFTEAMEELSPVDRIDWLAAQAVAAAPDSPLSIALATELVTALLACQRRHETVAVLLGMAKSAHLFIVRGAVRSLAVNDFHAELVELGVIFSESPNMERRYFARTEVANALAWGYPLHAVHFYRDLLREGHELSDVSAVVGAFGEAGKHKELIELTQDQPHLRLYAAELLADKGDLSALEDIEQVAADEEARTQTRREAIGYLARFGATQQITRFLEHWARCSMMKLLFGDFPSGDVAQAAVDALNDLRAHADLARVVGDWRMPVWLRERAKLLLPPALRRRPSWQVIVVDTLRALVRVLGKAVALPFCIVAIVLDPVASLLFLLAILFIQFVRLTIPKRAGRQSSHP